MKEYYKNYLSKETLKRIKEIKGFFDHEDDEYYREVCINNKKLCDMAQYPISRKLFMNIFNDADLLTFGEGINAGTTSNFKWWNDSDGEHYILHLPSGTLINWYKHLGRCLTCNKKLTEEEYKLFANYFVYELLSELYEVNL